MIAPGQRRPRRSLRRAPWLALGAAGLLVCACGEEPQLSRSQAIAAADGVCAQATGSTQFYAGTRPAPAGPAAVARTLDGDATGAALVARRLRTLRLPPERRRWFEAYVDALEVAGDVMEAQARALLAGDQERYRELSSELLAQNRRARNAARTYGLRYCPYRTLTAVYAGVRDDRIPYGPIGIWTGRVTELVHGRPRAHYPTVLEIRLTSTLGGPVGRIHYPSLGCVGRLYLLAMDAPTYRFVERIDVGQRRCTEGGTIRVTVAGRRESFRWSGGGRVVVEGTLRRQ